MHKWVTLVGKRQYLNIYTQANIEKFPTTVSLGEVTDEEFNAECSKITGRFAKSLMKMVASTTVVVLSSLEPKSR